MIYHLWPQRLTGGFVGVDVFFVISGFLITLHLMREPPSGRLATWPTFWGRRSGGCCRPRCSCSPRRWSAPGLVAPGHPVGATPPARHGAATLYVVNWLLARDSVDYLAAENAPSPVQHFWSLSVEEQFYFVWPILILVWSSPHAAFGWNRDIAVLAGLAVLVTASLGYSIWETAHNPPAAYFVTPTRMWELGIGGLLAVVVAVRQRRGLGTLLPQRHASRSPGLGLAAIALDGLDVHRARPRSPAGRPRSPCWAPPLVIGAAAPMSRLVTRAAARGSAPCSGSATSPTRSTCGTGR